MIVQVKTKSIKNEVVEKNGKLYVYVTVPPHKDKANKKVIELLAKHLNVSKSRLEIKKGGKSKIKIIKVL